MKKIRDFFFAGVIAGIIGGFFTDMLVVLFLLIGVKMHTPWGDMAALFFKPPLVYSSLAKLFGFIISLGVSVTNGIIMAFLLKYTGKDYVYTKCIVYSLASGYFAFMILYPALGFKLIQYSISTHYAATLIFILYGFLMGYLLAKHTVFKTDKNQPDPAIILVEVEKPTIFQRIKNRIRP